MAGDQQRLHAAFERRAEALRSAGAQHLVDNLQPGAKPLAVSRLEGKLGFPLPKALRTLWLLHDGEKRPAEGFAAPFHLLPVAWVLNERVKSARRLERLGPHPGVVTEEERSPARWIPVAARPGASVVLHATSGRVFECADEDPGVRLLAPSLVGWVESLAEQPIAADDEAG